ncbi:zinc transport system permease protein [Sulfurivirga caldicuralii]|uniref:High-affinity zinc uptake system membrane protein ZnuB n=1 Tax=Sulfurivirga caldicuralii TaxID=364032 RepID=A0A1N6G232_9GAMM|nr:iron chelate uptake ABC transporter family permease subunit [Sulfurivirga caldicuralii]SIO01547.1 zinc transport system permease protein [Sulfurivirga caldicuralii]
MNDWLLWIGLAGIMLGLTAALLGVFVVWQKQSYFGATLAHTALLGVALGLLLRIDWQWSVIAVALLTGWAVHALMRRTRLSSDTLLGMLAHSTLAIALVLLSYTPVQISLDSLLFGDLLAITPQDAWLLSGLTLLTGLFYWRHWRDLLNITLNRELAFAEGVPVQRVERLFILLLSLVIALSIKLVGVLLITSLLILPPAAARHLSRTPEQMLAGSVLIAVVSGVGGLALSWQLDWPSGPAIVVVATAGFLLLLPLRRGQ